MERFMIMAAEISGGTRTLTTWFQEYVNYEFCVKIAETMEHTLNRYATGAVEFTVTCLQLGIAS